MANTPQNDGGKKSGVYREYTIIMLIAYAILILVVVGPFVRMAFGHIGSNTVAFGLMFALILILADAFIVIRLARNVISRHEIIDIDSLRQNEVAQAIQRVISENGWVATQGPEQYNFVKPSRLTTMPTVSIGFLPAGQNIQADIYISGGSVGKYGDLKRPAPALKMKDALLDALAQYAPGANNGPGQQWPTSAPTAGNSQTAASQYMNL